MSKFLNPLIEMAFQDHLKSANIYLQFHGIFLWNRLSEQLELENLEQHFSFSFWPSFNCLFVVFFTHGEELTLNLPTLSSDFPLFYTYSMLTHRYMKFLFLFEHMIQSQVIFVVAFGNLASLVTGLQIGTNK